MVKFKFPASMSHLYWVWLQVLQRSAASTPSENLLLAKEEMEREDSMTVKDVVPMRVSI